MMLTVGRWLHGKSSTAAWNKYVDRQMQGALAKGNLWYLFFIAALAILREGAETTIFYAGMAPAIDTSQLLLGIGSALVVLIILGYAMIALSARLPVAAFFRAATVLIYYLVFRFLGESLHALQIAGKLPAHNGQSLPSIGWLGIYPTWETTLPQLLILAFILWERCAADGLPIGQRLQTGSRSKHFYYKELQSCACAPQTRRLQLFVSPATCQTLRDAFFTVN